MTASLCISSSRLHAVEMVDGRLATKMRRHARHSQRLRIKECPTWVSYKVQHDHRRVWEDNIFSDQKTACQQQHRRCPPRRVTNDDARGDRGEGIVKRMPATARLPKLKVHGSELLTVTPAHLRSRRLPAPLVGILVLLCLRMYLME